MNSFAEAFSAFDTSFFLIINHKLHAKFLDPVMLLLSYPGKGFAVLVLGWIVTAIAFGRRGRTVALLIAISLALTDSISVRIFKPLVERPRPNHPDYIVQNARCFYGYNSSNSYPSAHAANSAGVACIFAFAFPQTTAAWFILAAGIGYSRIYLAQHFPADVVGGYLLGLVVSLTLIVFAQKLKWFEKEKI